MSPKAVSICNTVHPDYHVKEVNGFNYTIPGVESFDLVYHSAVMCQTDHVNRKGLPTTGEYMERPS